MTKYFDPKGNWLYNFLNEGKPCTITDDRIAATEGYDLDELCTIYPFKIIPTLDTNYNEVLLYHEGEDWRCDQIEQAVNNVLSGIISMSDYHRLMGQALGYSPEDIEEFVKDCDGKNIMDEYREQAECGLIKK